MNSFLRIASSVSLDAVKTRFSLQVGRRHPAEDVFPMPPSLHVAASHPDLVISTLSDVGGAQADTKLFGEMEADRWSARLQAGAPFLRPGVDKLPALPTPVC